MALNIRLHILQLWKFIQKNYDAEIVHSFFLIELILRTSNDWTMTVNKYEYPEKPNFSYEMLNGVNA